MVVESRGLSVARNGSRRVYAYRLVAAVLLLLSVRVWMEAIGTWIVLILSVAIIPPRSSTVTTTARSRSPRVPDVLRPVLALR
ncbi:hypothetical protein GCM10009670_08280 [Citricoccus alkalitolerans]